MNVTVYQRGNVQQGRQRSLQYYLEQYKTDVVSSVHIHPDLLAYIDTKGNFYVSSTASRELEFTQHQIFTYDCLYCFYNSQAQICVAIGRDQQDEMSLKSFDINGGRPVLKYKNSLQNTKIFYAKLSDSGRFLLLSTDQGVSIYKVPKYKLIAQSQENLFISSKVIYGGFYQQYDGLLTLQPQNMEKNAPHISEQVENVTEISENAVQESPNLLNAYNIINDAIKQKSSETERKIQQESADRSKADEHKTNQTKNNILTTLLILENAQKTVSIALFSVNLHQQNSFCSRIVTEYSFTEESKQQILANQIQYLNNSLVFNLKQNYTNTLTLMQIKSKDEIVSVNSIEKLSDISFQSLHHNLNLDNIQMIQTNSQNEILIITNQHIYIYDPFKNRINFSEPVEKTFINILYNKEQKIYYLLTMNLEIIQLKPLNNQQIIKNLVNACLFVEALDLAQAHTANQALNTTEIREKYAHYLLEYGQYAEATQQFKMIIGSGNTSLAIKALFDKNLISHLISYLLAIHNKNLQTEHHTILLISLFAKSNDKQEAVSFIRGFEKSIFENSQSNNLLTISVSSNQTLVKKEYVNNICEALIKSQFVNLSVEFAMLSRNEELACDYLMLNQRLEEVIMILHCLPYQKAYNVINKHGVLLTHFAIQYENKKYIEKICELIHDLCINYVVYDLDGLNSFYNTLNQQIDSSKEKISSLSVSCSNVHDDQTKYEYFGLYKEQKKKNKDINPKNDIKQANIQQFIHIFSDERAEHYLVSLLLKLFQAQISQSQALRDQNQQSNRIQQVQYLNDMAIELLFELLLKLQGKCFEMLQNLNITTQFVTDTLQTLLNNIQLFPTVQLEHLTMLFNIAGNNECMIKILEHQGELQECLELYCQNKQYEQALVTFKRLPVQQQEQLCIDIIKQIASAPDNIQYIQQILEYLQNDAPFHVDPVNVINVLVQMNPDLDFSTVTTFISNSIQAQEDEYMMIKQRNDELISEIRRTDEELQKLQQITVLKKDECNKCNLPLDLPCICLGCGHKYHERCWKSIDQKCVCQETPDQDFQANLQFSEDDIFKSLIGNQELLAQFSFQEVV